MNAVIDGWVRDIVSVDTHNSTTFGSTRPPRHDRQRAHPAHDAVHRARRAGRFCDLRHADSARSVERHRAGRLAGRDAGRRDGTQRGPQFQEHDRRHRAASAMGDRTARRQQRVHRRHRSAAEHRVLESRARRLRSRLERRLGRRVERESRSAAHSAAARLEELVHRLHRTLHADPLAQRIDSDSRESVRNARVSRRACGACEPVPRTAARSTRRTGAARTSGDDRGRE